MIIKGQNVYDKKTNENADQKLVTVKVQFNQITKTYYLAYLFGRKPGV